MYLLLPHVRMQPVPGCCKAEGSLLSSEPPLELLGAALLAVEQVVHQSEAGAAALLWT